MVCRFNGRRFGGGWGVEQVDAVAGGLGSGQGLLDIAQHLCGEGAGWGRFGGNAEEPGELEPPEELFVGFAEDVVVAFGGVNAGEPAEVGI